MEKKQAILRSWRVYKNHLIGRCYGHPEFPDGTEVMTSEIVKLDRKTNTAETLNTVYALKNAALKTAQDEATN